MSGFWVRWGVFMGGWWTVGRARARRWLLPLVVPPSRQRRRFIAGFSMSFQLTHPHAYDRRKVIAVAGARGIVGSVQKISLPMGKAYRYTP